MTLDIGLETNLLILLLVFTFIFHLGANSFAIFGLVEMNALQNFEEGYRCAELSLKLMEAIKCPELTARTYATVFGFLKAFKEPLRNGLKPLEDAYRLNVLTGDVEVRITRPPKPILPWN